MSNDTLKEEVQKHLKQYFLQPISIQITHELQKIERIIAHIQAFQSSKKQSESHKSVAKYAAEFHSIMDETWKAPEERKFSEVYSDFSVAMKSLIELIPESQVKQQSKNRFYAHEDDSRILRSKKWFKRFSYSISKLFVKQFRNKFWNHKVPLRTLASYHFESQLILDLSEVTGFFYKTFSALYLKIKEAEENLSDEGIKIPKALIDEVLIELQNLNPSIEERVGEILEKRCSQYNHDQKIVDTIELSSKRFAKNKVDKSIIRSEKKWSQNRKNWNNTIYALFEEWRSDLDIFHLKSITLAELNSFKSAQIRKLGAQIDPEIEGILLKLNEGKEKLDKKLNNPKSTLVSLASELEKELRENLVPKLCEKLASQNITNLVNKLEANICKSVENLTDEHVRVKTSTYDLPLDDDELKKISLYELISFETLTTFKEDFEEVKKGLIQALEDAITYFADLPQIISFSISSSLNALDEDKEGEEASAICIDALNRAHSRIGDTRKQLESAIAENSEELDQVVGKFCESIVELTYKENVGELRLRIAKAKATKQAEEVKEQLKQRFEDRKKQTLNLGSTIYQRIESVVKKVSKQFILTAGKPEITREASDFLLKSQSVIDNLPLIYRRLYKVEPVENLDLFEGREEELQQLKASFESWSNGHYSSTAILGEKWGGLTSFLNCAIEKLKFPYATTRYSLKKNIDSEDGLLVLMKEVLNDDTFENIDQVVAHLNNGVKQIIILEDLQNLFLKRIGGFEALQTLFQVIARTYKSVFWITSTTLYTWEYLKKTIHIQEYFSYSIPLGDLSKEQIINVIWKRNRISGYSILFEPDEDHSKDKKFTKLNEVEKQETLKNEYFAELNSFAKSNVSLALIFWLLSTKKMDKNVVTIGEFKKPDLAFLNVMSMDKLYIIHSLVLHDGLSEYQLSEVLNVTTTESRLTLLALLEDGVITKNNLGYTVNPIVYRSVISVLKAKNLIH